MNRGVEITSDVADSEHSVILQQVTNGVAVRMAVLYLLAGGSRRTVSIITYRKPTIKLIMTSKYSRFDKPARAENLYLQGARVVDPCAGIDQVLNLHIVDGVLQSTAQESPQGADVIDLRGHWITLVGLTCMSTCVNRAKRSRKRLHLAVWPR